jgi:hypothetical protein
LGYIGAVDLHFNVMHLVAYRTEHRFQNDDRNTAFGRPRRRASTSSYVLTPPKFLISHSYRWKDCGIEETFGELLQKAFLSGPDSLPAASEGGSEDETDDDLIPDVWVRKFDAEHNSVTETGQWWEHQPASAKLRDVFSVSEKRSESEQKQWAVEVVEKKGDYVVALVSDNGVEMGKAVGE